MGTDRGETIDGRGGSDMICSGGGDDAINGGAGDDRIDRLRRCERHLRFHRAEDEDGASSAVTTQKRRRDQDADRRYAAGGDRPGAAGREHPRRPKQARPELTEQDRASAAALGAGMFTQEFWDERYASRSAVWSGNPNPHLVSQASELSAGTALDVGGGEGADAIWLAGRGWQVTALDVSTVALQRGASRAAEVGADVARRIQWLHEDVFTWIPAPSSFDLVSAQFMHLPTGPREEVFARLAAAVAPDGTLLIVGHHPLDLQTTIPRPQMPELFFTASEVAASLDPHAWEIVVDAAPERSTADPEGRTVTIHDALLRARRRE